MKFKKSLTALFLALSISVPVLAQQPQQQAQKKQRAQQKKVVSLKNYWALQAKHGKTVAHMRYTPFPKQTIRIPVQSKTHGKIAVQFNTHTFMPVRKPDGNVSLIPTIAVISAVHSGLGKYNNNDADSTKRAMNLLAQSPEIPTVDKLRQITGDDHLEQVHGIDLFDIEKGRIKPGKQMRTILQACKQELK